MPEYLMLSGETITHDEQDPKVLDHLALVHAAAADPSVGQDKMIELVYGPTNPILDWSLVPGRPMVTRAVFDNPIFAIMSDLIGVKRIQLGFVDPVASAACYTVSVNEAAEQLGITPSSVRNAIKGRKLAGIMRNGQLYTRPEAVASYKVSNRGRKKADPQFSRVRGCIGNEAGHSLSVKIVDGEYVREQKSGNAIVGNFSPGWLSAVVKHSVTADVATDGRKKVCGYIIEPAPGKKEHIGAGGMFIEGEFLIVKEAENFGEVRAMWDSVEDAKRVTQ